MLKPLGNTCTDCYYQVCFLKKKKEEIFGYVYKGCHVRNWEKRVT